MSLISPGSAMVTWARIFREAGSPAGRRVFAHGFATASVIRRVVGAVHPWGGPGRRFCRHARSDRKGATPRALPQVPAAGSFRGDRQSMGGEGHRLGGCSLGDHEADPHRRGVPEGRPGLHRRHGRGDGSGRIRCRAGRGPSRRRVRQAGRGAGGPGQQWRGWLRRRPVSEASRRSSRSACPDRGPCSRGNASGDPGAGPWRANSRSGCLD